MMSFRPFSMMDLCCAGMVIRGAWLFDKPLNYNLMADGFRQLLDEYPFLAGRMSIEGHGIECNGTGASLLFAENSRLSVKDLAANSDFAAGRLYNRYAPKFDLNDFKKGKCAPIIAEVTQIAGGSLLTVQCSHLCFDGHSFHGMVKRWGEICCSMQGNCDGATIGSSNAVSDQSLAPKGSSRSKEETIKMVQQKGWIRLSGRKLIKMIMGMLSGASRKYVQTVHLSHNEVEHIKAECGEGIGTNAALSAYVVKMIMKRGTAGEYSLLTVADLRGRWNGLPEAFVGNASGNIVTHGLSQQDTLSQLSAKIQQNVSGTLSNEKTLNEIVELSVDSFKYKIPYVAFDVAAMNSRKPSTVYINNFLKFKPYDVDFGCGRPVLAIPNDLPDMVRFWPAQDNGVDIILRGYPSRM